MNKQLELPTPCSVVSDIDLEYIANRTFALIENVESVVPEQENFLLIRKKLLDIANDLLRLKRGG